MNTILVVDDEASVREMVEAMLETEGYKIETAKNGRYALQQLSKHSISLVVTDIVMADENGIDLIMKMKNTYPDIPIIAISGGGGIEGRFDYLEIAKLVGANHILKKPFSAAEIRKLVKENLNNL